MQPYHMHLVRQDQVHVPIRVGPSGPTRIYIYLKDQVLVHQDQYLTVQVLVRQDQYLYEHTHQVRQDLVCIRIHTAP